LWTLAQWGRKSSNVVDKTNAIRDRFYDGTTYQTASSAIAALASMPGEAVTTTPANKGEAQYKAASIMYMIGMLPGINESNKRMIGEKADEVYNLTWYGVAAETGAATEEAAQEGNVAVLMAGGLAKGGGASPSEVDSLLRWGGQIAEQTTAANVEQRQELEEDRTLKGQAKDIAGERLQEATAWSCFVSRVFGVNTTVCPEETTGQKIGRYAVYAGGVFVAGGILLYLGRPYIEALQGIREGDE
jgi:hypothetical protein